MKIKIPKIDLKHLKNLSKDRKSLIAKGVIALGIIIVGIIFIDAKPKEEVAGPVDVEALEALEVRELVEGFGRRHALVSLVADKEIRDKAISGHFSYYASSELVKKWQKDPENAPGRLTSSPWPDRIEIDSLVKNEDGTYAVTGRLIEVTSDTKVKDGISAEYPVTLKLSNASGKWIIVQYEKTLPPAPELEEDMNGAEENN